MTHVCRQIAYCTEKCSRLSLKLMSFQSTTCLSSFRICHQPLWLYSLFKEQPCGMAEKPVLPGTPNWKPSQPSRGSPIFQTSHSLLTGFTFGPRLYVGTRLLRLGMENTRLFPLECSTYSRVQKMHMSNLLCHNPIR